MHSRGWPLEDYRDFAVLQSESCRGLLPARHGAVKRCQNRRVYSAMAFCWEDTQMFTDGRTRI